MPYNAKEMRTALDKNIQELKAMSSFSAEDKNMMMIENNVSNAHGYVDNLSTGPSAEELAAATPEEKEELAKMMAEMQPELLKSFEDVGFMAMHVKYETLLLASCLTEKDKGEARLIVTKIKNNLSETLDEARRCLDAMLPLPRVAPAT